MVTTRALDFDKARTNLEDACQAAKRIQRDEEVQDDLEHFISTAGDAMSEYPSHMPYSEEYQKALDAKNPDGALRALGNIVRVVREYDTSEEQFDFSYAESELDRVDEAVSNL